MRTFSKSLRPPAGAVKDTQYLDRIAYDAIGDDERRPRNHELTCSRNSAGSPQFNIGAQRREILHCLGRPDRGHERVGIGRSLRLPHDVTHSLTCSCEIPSPRSTEAIARLIPATCHSLTSRYSLIASAARKDRLRPVLLASLSSRFFAAASTRTVKVVVAIARSVLACVQDSTKQAYRQLVPCRARRPMLAHRRRESACACPAGSKATAASVVSNRKVKVS
jgi:hypothetical protein